MGSVYERKDSPFLWLKWRDAAGVKRQERTRFRKGDPAQLEESRRTLELLERRVAAERKLADGVLTVRAYSESWVKGLRQRRLLSADQYSAKLRNHILPELGDLPLREVRPHHVADLVTVLRAPERGLAPRTVRDTYGVLRNMFRRALRQELVPASPCVLEEHELPENEDADPAWRATAVFSRGEVERLLSDDRLPEDRRALYAMLFLGGLRIGEALDRRWTDYDAAAEPLGRLAVTTSWSSQDGLARSTKTRVAREVPVHPLLAQLLAEWRLRGWAALMGRPPRDEDLLFPEPPSSRSRRADPEEEHRHAVVALKRLHRDLELLGLRLRRQHDARRTFISLAQADGAPPHLLKWVTHGHRSSVMDQYTTAPWAELCGAVAKLRIRRLGAREVTALAAIAGGANGPEGEHQGGDRSEGVATSVRPTGRVGGAERRSVGGGSGAPRVRRRMGGGLDSGRQSGADALAPARPAQDLRASELRSATPPENAPELAHFASDPRGTGGRKLSKCHATEGAVTDRELPPRTGGPEAASPARTGPAAPPDGAVSRPPTRMGSADVTAQSRPGAARELRPATPADNTPEHADFGARSSSSTSCRGDDSVPATPHLWGGSGPDGLQPHPEQPIQRSRAATLGPRVTVVTADGFTSVPLAELPSSPPLSGARPPSGLTEADPGGYLALAARNGFTVERGR